MKLLLVVITFAIVALSGCSGSGLAGGTGTETTNGGVAMVAGSPAGGALVRLIDTDQWLLKASNRESVVLDSVVADQNGRFTFNVLPGRHYNVQIDHSLGALLLLDHHLNGDTLALAENASYRGSITLKNGPVTGALLAGSAYRAETVTAGQFRFRAVAPGIYPIVALHGANATGGVAFGGTRIFEQNVEKYGDTLVADTGVVPLDGFAAGFGMSELGYLIGGTWWYYYSDSLSRNYNPHTREWEFAAINPYGGNTFIRPVLLSDNSGNTMLSASVVLGSGVDYPVGGIGISLGKVEDRGVDLSSMTSFSFRARGKGTLRLRLESLVLDSVDVHKQYTSIVSLPDNWTQFSIVPGSLHIDLPDSVLEQSIPWATAGGAIKRIEFEFLFNKNSVGDTLLLELDNLAFEGVSLRELRK